MRKSWNQKIRIWVYIDFEGNVNEGMFQVTVRSSDALRRSQRPSALPTLLSASDTTRELDEDYLVRVNQVNEYAARWCSSGAPSEKVSEVKRRAFYFAVRLLWFGLILSWLSGHRSCHFGPPCAYDSPVSGSNSGDITRSLFLLTHSSRC